MKRWFWSRTVWANLAVAAVATWFDRSDFYVNPLFFVWAIAGLNLALRRMTREGIT